LGRIAGAVSLALLVAGVALFAYGLALVALGPAVSITSTPIIIPEYDFVVLKPGNYSRLVEEYIRLTSVSGVGNSAIKLQAAVPEHLNESVIKFVSGVFEARLENKPAQPAVSFTIRACNAHDCSELASGEVQILQQLVSDGVKVVCGPGAAEATYTCKVEFEIHESAGDLRVVEVIATPSQGVTLSHIDMGAAIQYYETYEVEEETVTLTKSASMHFVDVVKYDFTDFVKGVAAALTGLLLVVVSAYLRPRQATGPSSLF